MFNFRSVQESITAFTNTAQDELFKHYDDRNKARLRKLRTKASVTEDLTEELKILASNVISILNKIDNNGLKQGQIVIEKLGKKRSNEPEKAYLDEEQVKKKVKKGIKDYFEELRIKKE